LIGRHGVEDIDGVMICMCGYSLYGVLRPHLRRAGAAVGWSRGYRQHTRLETEEGTCVDYEEHCEGRCIPWAEHSNTPHSR
jgi:hypothetical protein